ncbi:ricin-type beta-trefoil lectin domain protein [Kineosporia babensis]|uniref:RICIN domain-containing protein n=1 Tax=Kineosporia babensis TaxID=499548 RepID=A0A9X1NK07_9ACTN|nr:ricin-type beta-trefoil lectin domain protein [Kineosporia babensis]MCD5314989.1 RICIN domain-containing protein [Kineosporia babensis]
MKASRRAFGRASVVLAVLFSILAASFVFADSASAVTARNYWNASLGKSHWLGGPLKQEGPMKTGGINTFIIQQLSDSPSGKDRVFLKLYDSKNCLDSHAASNAQAAWAVKCNGGDYQIWEVFYQKDNSRVFKSWGAWTKQRKHLCLAGWQSGAVVMANCNESALNQRWYSQTAPSFD